MPASDLPLSLYLKGDYFNVPWQGSSSQGSSGARSATETEQIASAPPMISKSCNGNTGADCNGIGHSDVPWRFLTVSGQLADVVSSSDYSIVLVVVLRGGLTNFVGGPAGTEYIKNTAFFAGSQGYLGVHFRTDPNAPGGPKHYALVAHFNGSEYAIREVEVSLNTPIQVHVRYKQGVGLQIGLNGVFGQALACGDLDSGFPVGGTNILLLGRNYLAAGYPNGILYRAYASTQSLTDAQHLTLASEIQSEMNLPNGYDDAPVTCEPFDPVIPSNSHAYTTTALTNGVTGLELPMDGAKLRWFKGKYWLIGGWWPQASWGSGSTNRVLSSLNACDWTLQLAHDANPPVTGAGARFRPRHNFMDFEAFGRLYIFGGDGEDGVPNPSDGWRSGIGDATQWERIFQSAPWGHLSGDGQIRISTYDPIRNQVHVLGGARRIDLKALTEHWVGTFNSDGSAIVSWQRRPDMPFARMGVLKALLVEDKLIVITGAAGYLNYPTFEATVYAYNLANWVWALQGSLPSTANPRYWVAVEYWDGKIWFLTGRSEQSPPREEKNCFHSSDMGQSWIEVPNVAWPASHADGCVATPIGIHLVSGYTLGNKSYLLHIDPWWIPSQAA